MNSVQDRTSLTKSTLIDHIARVELRVRDVPRSLAFYRDVAGLAVLEESPSRAVLGVPSAPGFLTLASEGVTDPADPRSTGLFHVAIRFPTRASLGDALARLVDAGYAVGAGDHLVSEALYIDDPDGNGVELYWDRPTAEWPQPQGDMIVPMATLAVDLEGLLANGRGRAAVGDGAPEGTDVGHVHLQVSEVGRTVRFYQEALGLDLIAQMGSQAGFFSSNAYHHHIGANTWRSRGSRFSGAHHAGLDRVVFAATKDELSGLRHRLSDAATEFSDQGGTLVVRDPDGIELNFATV